ncbi:hypothetical protein MRS44_003773 [Fusarium solani]|uniref:uncharacterized protein n=1 Tax=Fusarium solani TaxID=169388 RepID=UPI0032C3F715|nr:hypothetical protein MRS44_003773 [Fusarium solani]
MNHKGRQFPVQNLSNPRVPGCSVVNISRPSPRATCHEIRVKGIRSDDIARVFVDFPPPLTSVQLTPTRRTLYRDARLEFEVRETTAVTLQVICIEERQKVFDSLPEGEKRRLKVMATIKDQKDAQSDEVWSESEAHKTVMLCWPQRTVCATASLEVRIYSQPHPHNALMVPEDGSQHSALQAYQKLMLALKASTAEHESRVLLMT